VSIIQPIAKPAKAKAGVPCSLSPGLAIVASLFLCLSSHAQVVISEILLNPPGTDTPNEYIELRGPPNKVLSPGTFFLAVEGDLNGNPGTIQNVFDLSGKQIGGNGFLLLLQKTNSYTVNSNATILVNSGKGAGWGNGSSSSIGHRGEGGQTELENGSVTFFLVQSPTAPSIGADIDSDDDGVPDGSLVGSWTILDSIGVLDDSGAGDIAYGAINFRRNPAATASGNIVQISFTPDYVGRVGNSTDSAIASWAASSSLGGLAPNWTLGSAANTAPASMALAPLNHIGGPNFGAPPLPGLVALQGGGSTDILEGSGTDSYLIYPNTDSLGPLTVKADVSGPLQISTDGGVTFAASRTFTVSATATQTVVVRAIADDAIGTSPRILPITHQVIATSDSVHYPLGSLTPMVNVNVKEKDTVLLSELKVNPPGPDDPFEFIEIQGPPNALLTNVYFLAVEGNNGANPGTATTVINLTSARLGSDGLLVILANGSPYPIPSTTTTFFDSHLNIPGGALGNGTVSFFLLSAPTAISEGDDLDAGDNGILEGLPVGAFIMDCVGWSDGNTNDIVYGGVILSQTNGPPEAATRFRWNNTPRSADAWFFGKLKGTLGTTLDYDINAASANFPIGTMLTPGIITNSAPGAQGLVNLSGVIGDQHNPSLTFQLIDADSTSDQLSVHVSSSNALVITDAQLILNPLAAAGSYNLSFNPAGVGYSTIYVDVSDQQVTNRLSFLYAASAMGRPGGSFLIGGSDGSTAIPIDANWMLVGDDENQVLRLYSRSQSGFPARQFDMTPYLGLTDLDHGLPREVDIEGSTRSGNRLFWIGSHSHLSIDSASAEAPNRSRIFAVDLSGTGTNISLTYVGRYDYLKDDLVSWDQNNVHGKGANYYGLAASTEPGVDPKATNGFNIEGLTMMAGSANAALVGFRAPIIPAGGSQSGNTPTYTLLVPVLNFADLCASPEGPLPGSAIFGPPVELDLYGRGIRSIEGNVNGYMIVGGTPTANSGRYPLDFRLYTWSGDRNQAADQRAADLTGLSPEGIVQLPPAPWTPGSLIQLVSDNGTKVYYGDGIEAKHLTEPNFKKCRCDVVALGAIVKPEPIIVSTTLCSAACSPGFGPSAVTITWRSLKGLVYRLQFNYSLDADGWIDIAPDLQATGPYTIITDDQGQLNQLFYRVLVVQ